MCDRVDHPCLTSLTKRSWINVSTLRELESAFPLSGDLLKPILSQLLSPSDALDPDPLRIVCLQSIIRKSLRLLVANRLFDQMYEFLLSIPDANDRVSSFIYGAYACAISCTGLLLAIGKVHQTARSEIVADAYPLGRSRGLLH
jgi:hypothetical protein